MSIKIPNLKTNYLQSIVLESREGHAKREVFILPFPQAPDAVLHEGNIYKHSIASAYRQSTVVNIFDDQSFAHAKGADLSLFQKFALETRTGEAVAEVWGAASPQAPEIVTWGIRCFRHEIANVYRECFAVMAFEDEEQAKLAQEAAGGLL